MDFDHISNLVNAKDSLAIIVKQTSHLQEYIKT